MSMRFGIVVHVLRYSNTIIATQFSLHPQFFTSGPWRENNRPQVLWVGNDCYLPIILPFLKPLFYFLSRAAIDFFSSLSLVVSYPATSLVDHSIPQYSMWNTQLSQTHIAIRRDSSISTILKLYWKSASIQTIIYISLHMDFWKQEIDRGFVI